MQTSASTRLLETLVLCHSTFPSLHSLLVKKSYLHWIQLTLWVTWLLGTTFNLLTRLQTLSGSKQWKDRMGRERVTNDPMEAHYIGFNMWVNAVEQAGTTDVDAVREAMYGQTFPNLTGGQAVMLPNHHLAKPVLIGEINEVGQFDIISKTSEVDGDAWTDFLPQSANLKSDWKSLGCGMYDTTTNTCVQIKSNY